MAIYSNHRQQQMMEVSCPVSDTVTDKGVYLSHGFNLNCSIVCTISQEGGDQLPRFILSYSVIAGEF